MTPLPDFPLSEHEMYSCTITYTDENLHRGSNLVGCLILHINPFSIHVPNGYCSYGRHVRDRWKTWYHAFATLWSSQTVAQINGILQLQLSRNSILIYYWNSDYRKLHKICKWIWLDCNLQLFFPSFVIAINLSPSLLLLPWMTSIYLLFV